MFSLYNPKKPPFRLNMDIYYKVQCEKGNGYKTHIGTVGKKTLCGVDKKTLNTYYKRVKHISHMDEFLSNSEVCLTCKNLLPR